MTHSKNDNEWPSETMSDSRGQDQVIAVEKSTGNTGKTATSTSVGNDPPDWSMVPFSVLCPRCGCDVHGRSDAVCPDCDLELDWSILAPVEDLTCPGCKYHLYGLTKHRCPECGREFDWDQVIEDYRRQEPLFEFHWRQAPLRWLFRAIWLAFRPWVLWRRIDIHDPTPTAGLAILGGLTLLASVAVTLMLVYPIMRFLVWQALTFGLPQYSWLASWPYVPWDIEWRFATVIRASAIAAIVLVAWFLAAFGGLLVLRKSMSQCRVRNGHVFRVCVYSFLPVACYPAIAYSLSAGAAGTLSLLSITGYPAGLRNAVGPFLAFWRDEYGDPLLALGLLALSTVSMALSYRRYIQMPHSWGVALSASAIAFLTAIIVLFWLTGIF
ncbi:MAG: hypothetical protein ACE5E5_06430 [Phycisphaerae bacterium]